MICLSNLFDAIYFKSLVRTDKLQLSNYTKYTFISELDAKLLIMIVKISKDFFKIYNIKVLLWTFIGKDRMRKIVQSHPTTLVKFPWNRKLNLIDGFWYLKGQIKIYYFILRIFAQNSIKHQNRKVWLITTDRWTNKSCGVTWLLKTV